MRKKVYNRLNFQAPGRKKPGDIHRKALPGRRRERTKSPRPTRGMDVKDNRKNRNALRARGSPSPIRTNRRTPNRAARCRAATGPNRTVGAEV